MKGAAPPRATFRDVFAVREFRAVWFSEILSVAGDRLALVALTLLVYDRTRLPLLTALAYASGYLPWIIGGLFLAGLADRYPRRAVMVTCDLARAVLVTAMVIPGLPVLGLAALLFAATAFAPPFDSSRAAITPAILPGDLYPLGASVTQATFLAAQVAGVAVAGAAVEVTGVRPALAIDAVTFVLSGVLIGFGTRARPAAAEPGTGSPWARTRDGCRQVFGERGLRTVVLFGWLAVFYTVPEAVAAPYAAGLGGGPAATGLVLASTAFGTMIGTPLFTRFVRPRARASLMGPLAVLTCAALVLTAAAPGSCDLAGDLLAVGAVRHLPDRGQHRVCRQGAGRTARSGHRRRQHGNSRRPGSRFHRGRRRRELPRPRGGHRPMGRGRDGCRRGADPAMAPSVTTGLPPCRRTARSARRDESAGPARPTCRRAESSYFMALFDDTV